MLSGFFNMDGPFYKYGSLVFDLLVLNFMWAFFGGPLIIFILLGTGILVPLAEMPIFLTIILFLIMLNIGPATSALFYVCNRKVRDKDGYLLKDFFKSFRENYKQGVIITFILAFLGYILWFNISNISVFGSFSTVVYFLQLFIGIELCFVTIYIYPLLARFDLKIKEFFKFAFLMANKHLLTTVISVAIFFGIFFVCFKVPILMLFLFSGYAYIASIFFEKVFRNYMPKEVLAEEDEVDTWEYEEGEDLEIDIDLEQFSIGQKKEDEEE